MSTNRLGKPPLAIRRAKLDNLALVPANLLRFKAEYQRMANDLPQGHLLMVLPTRDTSPRRALEKAAALYRANGHQVTTILADQLSKLPVNSR